MELYGVAVGVMRVRPGDWYAMTPDEFAAAYEAWFRLHEADRRDAWEQVRQLAALTIAPHTTRSIAPAKLLPLPWDDRPEAPDSQPDAPELTAARLSGFAGRVQSLSSSQ